MDRELLSARQLCTAALAGGLSWAGVQAGRMDWRWGLAALAAGVALGWLLLRRAERKTLFQGPGGKVLTVLYAAWGVVLLACVLRRAAGRIIQTGGSEAGWGWILLLLALPLVWIGLGKCAAFFRLAELLWLAIAVIAAVLILLMLPKTEWKRLLVPAGSWLDSAMGMAQILTAGLYTLPHIYKVRQEERSRAGSLTWLTALGAVSVLLSALTAGVLGPALTAQLRDPFFAGISVLGRTARLEGLASALWLLPDLVLAGLLAQSWGRKPFPAVAVAVACGLAMAGIPQMISPTAMGIGGLMLVILTLILPVGKEK